MTLADYIDWAVKLIVALGGLGGLGAFFMVRAQRRKLLAESSRTDAEADSIVADAQSKRTQRELNILTAYERGVERLQEQLDEANVKIDRLMAYVEVLVQTVRASGTPVPPMPPMPSAAPVDHRAQ